MQTTANITIYLQALGGKFLGPHAYNTNSIILSLTLQGEAHPITYPITYQLSSSSDDGNISGTFNDRGTFNERVSSFMPILTIPPTAGNPAVNYLTADNTTICGFIAVPVSKPLVQGTISASIPTSTGDNIALTQTILLNQLEAEYKVIVVVPGLYLEKTAMPNMPSAIAVYVRMMCGCPVTTGISDNSYWAQNDFLVSAEVIRKNEKHDRVILAFSSNKTPSLFYAAVNDIASIRQVNFTAKQKSTGNIGYLSVNYPL